MQYIYYDMKSYLAWELNPEVFLAWLFEYNTVVFLLGIKFFEYFLFFFLKRGYKYRKPKDEETVKVEKKTKKSTSSLKSNPSASDKERKVKITVKGTKSESKNGLNKQSSEKKTAKSDLKKIKALRHVRKFASFMVCSS